METVTVFERERIEFEVQFLSQIQENPREMRLAKKKLAVVNKELEFEVLERSDHPREDIQESKQAELEKVKACTVEAEHEMVGAASHEFGQPFQGLLSDALFFEEHGGVGGHRCH